MSCEAVRNLVTFVAVLALSNYGEGIVFTQAQSSTFYSTYDARELVKSRKYKGIDFAYGDMGAGFTIEEVEKESGIQRGGSEKSNSTSYGCRIQTTGDDAFNMADFLDWLAKETISQIEGGKGKVVRQRHKVGKRFYIEYSQNGFAGRIEVDADVIGKDQMNLDVEIIESSRK
jgi:hypothetical protein